jgi:hypothetical protein
MIKVHDMNECKHYDETPYHVQFSIWQLKKRKN